MTEGNRWQTYRALLAKPWQWPRARWSILILALATVLPSLGAGLFGDDLLHREALHPELTPYAGPKLLAPDEAAAKLFQFFDPAGEHQQEFENKIGLIPWWAPQQLMVNFWRPLSALSHWLDYQLWPNQPWLMHGVTALIYAGSVWLLLLLLQGLAPSNKLIVMAGVLYCLDISHLFSLYWLANRNAILANLFCIATLYAHHQWRSQGHGIWMVGAPCLLLLGLLSAEAAIATTAYLFAYAWFLDSEQGWRRWMSLLPAAGVSIAWRALYVAQGYGSAHNGLYLDPVSQPLQYLLNLSIYWPSLMFGQLSAIDSLHLTLNPKWLPWYLVAALLLLSAGIWIARNLLRQQPLARFALVGSALALLPLCAVSGAGGRVQLLPSLGGTLFLALLLRHAWQRRRELPISWLRRGWSFLFGLVALIHIGLMIPLWLLLATAGALNGAGTLANSADVAEFVDTGNERIILVNSPSAFASLYLPQHYRYHGQTLPEYIMPLAPGFTDFTVSRRGERRFEVRSKTGFLIDHQELLLDTHAKPLGHVVFYYRAMNSIFSGNQQLRRPRQAITTGLGTVRVLQRTRNGRLQRFTFELNESIDPTQLLWLQWDWRSKQFQQLELLALGESWHIQAPH